jgi:hypothetical protein
MRYAIRGMVVAVLSIVLVQDATAWVTRIKGHSSSDSKARSLAIDADGNVLVGGTLGASQDGFLGAAKLAGEDGRVIWQERALPGWGTDLALDTALNPVVVGASDARFTPYSNDTGVVKLDTISGDPLFIYAPVKVGDHRLKAVGVDNTGNILAGGAASADGSPSGEFYVIKLSPEGDTLWQQYIAPFEIEDVKGNGLVLDLVVDAAGDVIAVGRIHSLSLRESNPPRTRIMLGPNHFTVAKLSGADGSIQWLQVLESASRAVAVAQDAVGDVIVAGETSSDPNAMSGQDFAVLKFRASDGIELWRAEIDGGLGGVKDMASAVAVDEVGDVYATGVLEATASDPNFGGYGEMFGGIGDLAVVKLAGSDGSEMWRYRLPNEVTSVGPFGFEGVRGQGNAIAVAADGNVVVAGARNATWLSSGAGQAREFVVLELDGDLGERIWMQTIDDGEAFALALEDDLSVVAAGWAMRDTTQGTTDDALVVKLSDRISGHRAQLRDDPVPANRRLKLSSKDRKILASAEESSGDPTLYGARLVLTQPDSLETHTYELPAEKWKAAGKGYLYRDKSGTAGPCQKVKIRNQSQISVACRGADLDLLSQAGPLGGLAARLELGDAATRYCIQFGGTVQGHSGTTQHHGGVIRRDGPTRFDAANAPAPPVCTGE